VAVKSRLAEPTNVTTVTSEPGPIDTRISSGFALVETAQEASWSQPLWM
jgi:hypothetical protein